MPFARLLLDFSKAPQLITSGNRLVISCFKPNYVPSSVNGISLHPVRCGGMMYEMLDCAFSPCFSFPIPLKTV